MPTKPICGHVTKQSQLGLSWNARYLVVNEHHIEVYKTQKEYEKNGNCKYHFNIADITMKMLHEQTNEVKMEISADKKYRFQIPVDLWKLLEKYYVDIKNKEISPKKESIDAAAAENEDEEQKTQDADTKEEITQSNDVFAPIETIKDNVLNESESLQTQNEQISNENKNIVQQDLILDEVKTEETEKKSWNEKYRNLLDINAHHENDEDLKSLISEFCTLCKINCVDIIENIIFPHNESNGDLDALQSIYVREEIEFKIIKSADEYNQIQSLITSSRKYEEAFNGAECRLYYPLSCIIEYLCYNIYCRVPLSSMTEENMIFGRSSLDNSFKFNETISKLLDQAAKKLNLASHVCKYDETMQISTTSKIQVYETESDVYYVDNIADLYPIDVVHYVKYVRGSDANVSVFNTALHPKLIESNPDPMSSDAFVPPNDDTHDLNASKVIYNLHSNIIPKFVENINDLKIKILSCKEFEQLMHERGISMIYIGEIYNLCTMRYAKEIIAIFMIADTIKEEMSKQVISSSDEYEEKLNYYVHCLTNDDDSYIVELGVKEKIISLVNCKFGIALNAQRMKTFPSKFVQYEIKHLFDIMTTSTKEKESITSFNCKVFMSVAEQYSKDINVAYNEGNEMQAIQKEWLQIQEENVGITNNKEFESFRGLCLSLMNKLDLLFPFHALKFEVMSKMVSAYEQITKQQKDETMVDYCCSLYSDCYDLATFLFGNNHRQTLMIKIQFIKWLYLNNKEMDSVDKLKQLLKCIQNVFGKTSLHSVIILKLLSEKYYEQRDYRKAIDFAKQHILILDERKRFSYDEYISIHLKISIIAEKIEDYSLGIRFLNKLYNYLRKCIERNNTQKLSENLDIKMLSLSISRIKLNMCNQQKFNVLQKKWKVFHKSKSNNKIGDYSMEEYNKCKQLIIQNLCLNPIKKSNDLLKNNADALQVICWINIIKEFEVNFLKIKA